MDKVYREIRCVSIEKNDVKFIPENLVNKPGYLDKHGLKVQELKEKPELSKVVEPEKEEPKLITPAPVVEVKNEEPDGIPEVKKENPVEAKTTGKIKVKA